MDGQLMAKRTDQGDGDKATPNILWGVGLRRVLGIVPGASAALFAREGHPEQ